MPTKSPTKLSPMQAALAARDERLAQAKATKIAESTAAMREFVDAAQSEMSAGRSMADVAQELGMSRQNLHLLFRKYQAA